MNETPIFAELRERLAKRILFLDGAMGTMVQRHELEEDDFRGERFADHAGDLKGNNDLRSHWHGGKAHALTRQMRAFLKHEVPFRGISLALRIYLHRNAF